MTKPNDELPRDARGASSTSRGEKQSGSPPPQSTLRPTWGWLMFVVLFLASYFVFARLVPDQQAPVEVPYSYFKQEIQAGNVSEIVSRGDTIQGTFKQAVTYPPEGQKDSRGTSEFSTVRPAFADPGLEELLDKQNVVINARPLEEPRSWWLNALLSFGPTILLIGGFLWLSKRAAGAMGGGGLGLGSHKAKRYDQTSPGDNAVTFADVAGIEEAEAELAEVVDFLKDPSKYTRLGGTAPKGVLLMGPPGTGKTLLARAVAGEAGVPFFSMGASEFVEMIVGVGASRVRDLFKEARAAAPAIVFIDELDAIGRSRGAAVSFGGHDEREQTLNQLLTEMDGFSSREGVIVLAATDRPDVLDAALLRAGRFDRRIVLQPPDKVGREAILRVHVRNVPLATDVDLKNLAASTPGLVGADLRNLVNEAALLAARRKREAVEQVDFMDALEKIALGPARQIVMSEDERERVAFHEGGHAILGLVVPGADPVNRVTIMPRGQALGVTYQRPEEDRHNYSEPYLRARVIGALGGRAAEDLVYGSRTTGSESDLQQATELVRQMVTRWGMSDKLGPISLAPRGGGFLGEPEQQAFLGAKPYGEASAQLIDAEVQAILESCYTEGLELLGRHRPELDRLATALLEQETLDEQHILEVTGLGRAPRLVAAPLQERLAAFSAEPAG